jgi:hypothetical protein
MSCTMGWNHFWQSVFPCNILSKHANIWVMKSNCCHLYFTITSSSKVHIFWEGHKKFGQYTTYNVTLLQSAVKKRVKEETNFSQNIRTLTTDCKNSDFKNSFVPLLGPFDGHCVSVLPCTTLHCRCFWSMDCRGVGTHGPMGLLALLHFD